MQRQYVAGSDLGSPLRFHKQEECRYAHRKLYKRGFLPFAVSFAVKPQQKTPQVAIFATLLIYLPPLNS